MTGVRGEVGNGERNVCALSWGWEHGKEKGGRGVLFENGELIVKSCRSYIPVLFC